MISWNCAGWNSRDNERTGDNALQALIEAHQPAIVLIQETFLRPDDPSPVLPGYTVYHADRRQARRNPDTVRGGGLLTLVHSSLRSSSTGTQLAFTEDNATESLTVTLHRGGHLPPVRITNLYRPPTKRGELRTRSLEVSALPAGEGTILAGDLNAHHASWSGRAADANGTRLFEWMMENQMFSWNDPAVPTMVAFSSSPDIVISSLEFEASSWRVLPAWGSDHRPLYFEFPSCEAPVMRASCRLPRYCWRLADWPTFTQALETSCESLTDLSNLKFLAHSFTTSVRKAMRSAVPKKSPKQREPLVERVWKAA